MPSKTITILGGGNTAFSTAARLSLDGHDVTLYEIPSFANALAPIQEERLIRLEGACGEGTAVLHRVTTNAAEAMAAAETILLIVPSYAHRAFAEACIPHTRPGQVIVLMPGNMGSLEWVRMLKIADRAGEVTMAEVDTAPYVCRKTGPATATIWGAVTGLGLGVFPANRTEEVAANLDALFPGIRTYPDVVACGLSAMNPVVHPAGVLMNAGRIEYSKGEFCFYEEGVTPSVVKVIEAVDEERRQIGTTLGYDLTPVAEAFHAAGFGPRGDLWAAINGSWMLTRLKAPGSLESRWLTEDIPYGLVSWCSLAGQIGLETPALRSLIDLGSVVMNFDAWKKGRTVKELGIEGLGASQLAAFLEKGFVDS